MEAMALFRRADPADPHKLAYMRIFMQSVYPFFCLVFTYRN
jgi:hypothetical protein